MLEAAHIQAYNEAGSFDVSNGLLLRADIQTLFDLGLISIDISDMTVVTAKALKNTVHGELNKRMLCFPKGTESKPNLDALHEHHRSFMQRQEKSLVL